MGKKFIIAIDLGGTNFRIALLNSNYKIICKQVLNTKALHKKEALIRAIISSVNGTIKDNSLRRADISGVGLGLPGAIDSEYGLVHYFPNIPGWKDVNLKRILEKRLRLRVYMDNDANLMCLAEYKLGAARGAQNAICITLGTGVGGGVIINRTLYRAATFAAGEIGHIPVNEDGPRCKCGGRACIEAYIGNQRILRMARAVFKRGVSLEEVSTLARKNNKKAIKVWEEVGRHLGIALVGIVNLLSPDCIVIGGGVSGAGKVLFNKVRRVVANQAMAVQAKHVRILPAKLGSDAGLIGAAVLVKES